MKLSQAFKMAAKSIVMKKGRSFLTMLGIIIGIASVMTIVSVVSGSNRKQREYYESMGTNRVNVSASYHDSSRSMFEELYAFCEGLGDIVTGVTPNAMCSGTARVGAKSSETMEWNLRPNIYFGSDCYAVCNNFELARGRDLTRVDIEEYKQVCVLGARAAKAFFDYSDPLGQDVVIDGRPYRVIGIYKEKDPNNEYSLDNVIVLPYSVNRFMKQPTMMGEFVIKVRDSRAIGEVITRVGDYIRTITQDQTIGYGYAYSTDTWAEQQNEQLAMMSLTLGGIAGISLLVGGIGIMNIMLVTVTERTREIGIRRAVGAERSVIVTQFLVEAAMICGIGGVIGIGLGYLLTYIAGQLLLSGMSVLPTVSVTMGAFGFSVILGILFGMYPAIKASGLQPVEALHAE
ncbi:MAG: ABC transporter permease [Oscillospiraceae bacterium]|nr:ABC transporter permease [Oscillospiraceae bacterium]MBR2897671.1 ABC transporter permease [Oscillospiraceae bacterium]MBR2977091.1 ABC transporter permease [Oscillospiraceae bacterium]